MQAVRDYFNDSDLQAVFTLENTACVDRLCDCSLKLSLSCIVY